MARYDISETLCDFLVSSNELEPEHFDLRHAFDRWLFEYKGWHDSTGGDLVIETVSGRYPKGKEPT